MKMDDLFGQPKMVQEAPDGGLLKSPYEDDKPKTMDEVYGEGKPGINKEMHQTVAQETSPEQEALVNRIHESTFMPKEIIRSDPRTAEAFDQYRSIQKVTATAPATARFLSMAENMALARDKAEALAKTETNILGYFGYNFASTPAQIASGNVASTYALDPDKPEDRERYIKSLVGTEKAKVLRAQAELIADGMGGEEARTEAVRRSIEADRDLWAGVRDMDAFAIPEEYRVPKTFWEKVAAGAGGSTPGMLLTAANPLIGTAFFTQQIYGSEFENYTAQGVAPERARDAALASALMQMPLEYAGNVVQLNRLTKMLGGGSLKTFLTGLVEGALSEGLEEYLQSYPQYFAEIYATNPDMTAGDALAAFLPKIASGEFQRDAIEQGLIGGTIGGIMQLPGAVRIQRQGRIVRQVVEDQHRQQRSQRETEALAVLRQDFIESEIAGRGKRAAEAFMRGIIEEHDGMPQDVYIPGEALAQTLEALPEESAIFSEHLGLSPEEVAQAAADGTDVVVPLVKYAAHAFGTQADAVLMNDLRLSPDTYTANQMQTVQQQFKEELEAQISALRSQEAAETTFDQERQSIYDDVIAKRLEAGVVENTAKEDAEVFAASMAAMSKRYGNGSPLELYKLIGLKIRGEEQGTARTGELSDKDGVTYSQESGQANTDTPEFKTWFGESKVVDAGGKPLVVYHGTNRDFEAFDKDYAAQGIFWFSSDRNKIERGDSGAAAFSKVKEVYLSANNLAGWEEYEKYTLGQIMDMGFDGIKLDDDYVIFSPTQIKSAYNRGTFDPNDPRMLFQTMSTRVPWAKGRQGDSLAEVLTLDFDVTLGDTRTLKSNMASIMGYPNMRPLTGKGSRTPAVQAEAFVEHAVNNLLALYDAVPEDVRDRAKLWYDGGNKVVRTWANRYGISEMQGAAVIAVLSPQKDWYQNLTQAERILDIVAGQQDFAWTPEMTAKADAISGGQKEAMGRAKGKTLGEVMDDKLAAACWIRVFDEVYNDRNYRIMAPEGGALNFSETSKGAESTSTWGTFGEIAKALSVIADGSVENVHLQIGGKHKVRNFYNNLFDPANAAFVTIDTHAVAAALLRPLAASDVEVTQNFGGAGSSSNSLTGQRGTYSIYAEAYRRAAEARGVLPREMQSITWEAVRSMFDGKKAKSWKDRIDSIWNRYKIGEIEQDEAQQLVMEAVGGVKTPSWSSREFNNKVSKTYARKAGVGFEVAPNPDNAALADRWRGLPLADQQDLTGEVAAAIVPRVLQELGLSGFMSETIGGYLGDTSAAMTLTLSDSSKLSEAAKALGYVLSQQSMVVAGPKRFKGGKKTGAVTIQLPDGYSAAEIKDLYDRLWQITGKNGDRLIGGHTTVADQMVIFNFTDLTAEELGAIIDSHLEGRFTVYVDPVYSAFIDEKEYGHDTQDQEGAPGGSSVGERLGGLRAEAAALLEDSLRSREAALRVRDGASGRSLSTGALGVETRYGNAIDGAVSVLGVHFSGQPRVTLSGQFYGTGLKGAEARRIAASGDTILSNRVHFYVDTGKGIVPEQGVGPHAHAVHLDNVYNEALDPLDLKAQISDIVDNDEWMNALEKLVFENGFDGIYVPRAQAGQGVVVLVGPQHTSVPVEEIQGKPSQTAQAVAELEVVPPGTIHPTKLNWAIPALVEKMVTVDGLKLPGELKLDDVMAMPRPRESAMRDAGVDIERYAPAQAKATSSLQQKDYAPAFFSRLVMYMEQKLPQKAPATAILQTLGSWKKKAPGFGSQKTTVRGREVDIPGPLTEELQWSGLEDWLKEQGKRKVTKQEILDYMRENQLEITEVHKQDIGIDPIDIENIGQSEFVYEGTDEDLGGDVYTYDLDNGDTIKVVEKDAEFGREYDGYINDNQATADDGSFQNALAYIGMEYEKRADRAVFGPSYTGGETLYTFGGENYREIVFTAPYSKAEDRLSMAVTGKSIAYKSPHWSEKNPIAHVRFQDFRDADGMKVLFLEEIQSDAVKAVLDGRTGALPMTTSSRWMKMVMRRMIRYAAENGYSRVAWTTGQMQIDRYDLSKQISRVEYLPETKTLRAFDLGGDGVLYKKAEPEKIEEYVGKEVAKKLLESDTYEAGSGKKVHALSGLDLKIGGEGKTALYDKQMPAMFNQLIKPWGVKVGTTTINVTDTGPTDVHSFDVTLDMVKDVLYVGQPLFQSKKSEEERTNAAVRLAIGDRGDTLIRMFNTANESSFLHESGHIFFELLGHLAQQPGATEEAKSDWKLVLDSVPEDLNGDSSGSAVGLTNKQHEFLARTMEGYFMQGKAPSLGLRKVFQKFADWLKDIYSSLRGLSVAAKQQINPSPEIMSLMDRLFATDEEIKQAQDYYGRRDAYHEEAAEISEEEHQKYLEALQEAEDVAKDNRLRRYIRAWAKVTGDRKEREARIRSQVEREPVYAAMDTIRNEENGRLDIDALDAIVGAETRKLLSKKGLTKQEGSDPEIMAARHGFDSVDAMVGAMLEAEKKSDRVKRLTDEEEATKAEELARYVEEKGTPSSAQDVHNDVALAALFMELDMLRKKLGPKASESAESALKSITAAARRNAVRDSARGQLGAMPVSQARRYDNFSRAEAKAAREAEAQTKKGRYEEAAQAKLRQIINHALVLEAVKVREEVAKAEAMVKRVKKQKSLLQESRNLINDIVIRFGFNTVPRSQVAQAFAQYRALAEEVGQKVETLTGWSDRMEEQGITVFAPEWVDNAPSRPNQELTLEQWRDVTDAIRSIQIADRMQRIVINDEKRRTREQLLADLTESAEKHASRKKAPSRNTGKVRDLVSATHAWHMKMEMALLDLDGGTPGLFWETFYLPFEQASNAEFHRLREANAKIDELFGVFSMKDRIRMSTKKEYIPEIKTSMTRWQIVMAALNSGNEGNLDRLKRGEGWTDAQHAAVIAMLTKEEMDFVQGIWDYIDTFREEAFALDKELTGRTPRRVEPRPLQTPHGIYQGGYFPVVTDPKLGLKASVQQSLDSLTKGGSLKGTHHASAVTRRGHLKERSKGTGEPLKLDPEVITGHIFQVVHDLTHRKAVQGVAQLANDSGIMKLFQDYAGIDMAKQLMPWVQDIAAEQNGPQSPIHKAARWARTGTTLMSMGFKATTGITQFVGYTSTIDQLKGWDKKWSAVGLATVYRNPANLPALLRETFEKSTFMEGRIKSFDRDIRDSSRRLSGKDAVKRKINEVAFLHIGVAQMGVDLPTWWAMYAKTMAETGDETKAVRAADSFVRQTQGSGATKDLARIQRGDDLMRAFTMFYSFFNTLYNMAYLSGKYIGKKGLGAGGVAAAAGSVMWLWILPALLAEYVAGRGPDDDEDALDWAMPIVGLYPTQAVVGLRDAANAIGTKFDYAATPAQAPVESVDRWVKAIEKAWEEEDATLAIKPTLQAAGYLFHLPMGQPLITGGNIVDYATGKDPDFYLRDLFFRKPKDRR